MLAADAIYDQIELSLSVSPPRTNPSAVITRIGLRVYPAKRQVAGAVLTHNREGMKMKKKLLGAACTSRVLVAGVAPA